MKAHTQEAPGVFGSVMWTFHSRRYMTCEVQQERAASEYWAKPTAVEVQDKRVSSEEVEELANIGCKVAGQVSSHPESAD